MKFLIKIILILVIAVAAYFYATSMMNSMYAYRSPLKDSPPAPGPALQQPAARRVVFVLIDALRYDTSLKTGVMPFLNELRSRAAYASMHSRPPSYSEPGYTVLLTGAWPDLSDGPAINLDYDLIPTFTQDNLFSAAKRAGLKTAVSGYYWFEKLIPQKDVDASFYTSLEDREADRQVMEAAMPWLKESCYNLTLIHLDQVDYAGHHEGGPVSPNWDAAAARADEYLRQIAGTLDFQQDVLFVASDHGQIDRGGHGGQDPITLVEPWVLAGAGVKPGNYGDVNMTDVAPTLAAILGTNLPASAEGQARTEMLELSAAQAAAIQQATQTQQNAVLSAYLSQVSPGFTSQITASSTHDLVANAQNQIDATRSARVARERLPRFVLAGILALLPLAALVYWRRQDRDWLRTLAWLAAAAVLYLLLFNLRYAVLSQRTYSLSSVGGAADIIVYCGVTAALALLVAWVAASLATGGFRLKPGAAAGRTLALVFVLLYLLALPVLWSFALNGLLVTWVLPDMLSMFVAFLSVIQIMFVAVVGLLLTGLAAVLGKAMAR